MKSEDQNKIYLLGGVVLRWQRNRTGRQLFPHKFIKRIFER